MPMPDTIEALKSEEVRSRIEAFRIKHRTSLLTLLFTDVEDSTGLKQRLGDATGVALLQWHEQVVRDTLRSIPDAQEISTAGDSFYTRWRWGT